MQVIINSSVVADGVVDLQVDCYKNGVLLCTIVLYGNLNQPLEINGIGVSDKAPSTEE